MPARMLILKRLFRGIVGWTARGVALLVVLVLLIPVAAILYTTTADFRARLLAYAVPELDRRMGGDLTVGGLAGSPLTALRLEDVALAWHGDEIVRIPEAEVALDWSALLLGELRIARIELSSPNLLFKEHAELGWDWRHALAPLVPGPEEPHEPRAHPLPIVIESLSLAQATLRIEAQGRAPLELPGIDLRGRIDFGEKRIDVEQAALALGASKLHAKGDLDFAGHTAFAITLESLAPRDLARLSPELAQSLDFLAPAHGELRLRGDKQALALEGELDWPEAALVFDASGRVDRPLLSESKVEATLEVKALQRFVPRSPVVGRLAARITLDHGAGTLDARLRPGQPSGSGGATNARANGSAAPGELAANGSFRLGDEPEAKLDVAATDFDPARAFPGHPEWKGALTARGPLTARGRSRATLAGSLALELGNSRIGALRLDRGKLSAKLAGDRLELAELSLESPIGRARVSGRASTSATGPLALKSRIDVAKLGPLLALAKQRGQGALTARIDVDGSLEKPRLAGEAAVTAFRLGDLRLERASLRLRGSVGRERRFEGVLESLALVSPLGAWRLEGATRFGVGGDAASLESARFASDDARLRLAGRLGRTGSQDFTLTARALPITDWARRFPERIPPDLLTRGTLDLDLAIRGTAALPIVDLALHPRELALADQSIDRVEATLRHADRRVRAELHATTEPSLRLDVEAQLPFALAWSAGLVARPTGDLVAKADGRADDLSLLEPFVARVVENLGGRANGHLELAGPLAALRPSGRITASDLTARPRRTGVTIASGQLEVELAADRFRLERATATVAGHETTARFRAEGEGPLPAFLTRLGRRPLATDAATADTTETTDTDYTTRIEIEQWPLVETRRDQLFASGVLRAHGSFEAPHVEGGLEIVKGTLRPNLAFLSSGPPPRDPTIELEPDPALGDAAAAGGTNGGNGTKGGAAATGASAVSRFEALELAVDVDLGRDLWIKHEQAEVLLAGRVVVRKASEKPLTLDGRIEAQRGFADLQGRRFRLMEGDLEFVAGPKIDPQLDVLGRYKAPAHTIDARLTGTASKPILTLTADPTLSQEDILAVLIFGRPASELSQQQQTSLGQRAEQLASAFGMTAVGRSLASAIGLEELGLQIEEISSTRAAIGAYVGRNIFVALAQEFSGERGQELSIEYEFLPGWSLVGSTTSQGTNAADLVWKIRY